MKMGLLKVTAFCLVGFVVAVADDGFLDLSIIHINDFHARYEETRPGGNPCREADDCIGGFSRVYATIQRLVEERPNPIVLNAGDNYQGTLWHNVFRWNVTQHFLNMLPTDATVLGNHEFDDRIAGVVPLLQTLKSPVVVCNIDDSLEPTIQGLYNKSVVIERQGKKIGIVGVILADTPSVTRSENLRFYDESESVNKEAQRLIEEEGVFTVIVLSHSGYKTELEIARKAVPGISLVVGAHSHTLLYTGTPPCGNVPEGPYPTVVESNHGVRIPVVQAWALAQYVGDITLTYNSTGNVVFWQGNPIYMAQNVPQDPVINELLEPWRQAVVDEGQRVLGKTMVRLDHSTCAFVECSFANFLTDATVYSYVSDAEEGSWTYAAIAIMNASGMRASIPIGNITMNDLVKSLPFGNTMDVGELKGTHIKEFLEFSATRFFDDDRDVNLMHSSGMRVVLDLRQPVGSRVASVQVRCNFCDIPRYEDLDMDKFYRIALPWFIKNGGDGFSIISDNLISHRTGCFDLDLLTEYVAQKSPIVTGLDGRLQIIR